MHLPEHPADADGLSTPVLVVSTVKEEVKLIPETAGRKGTLTIALTELADTADGNGLYAIRFAMAAVPLAVHTANGRNTPVFVDSPVCPDDIDSEFELIRRRKRAD